MQIQSRQKQVCACHVHGTQKPSARKLAFYGFNRKKSPCICGGIVHGKKNATGQHQPQNQCQNSPKIPPAIQIARHTEINIFSPKGGNDRKASVNPASQARIGWCGRSRCLLLVGYAHGKSMLAGRNRGRQCSVFRCGCKERQRIPKSDMRNPWLR